MQIVYLSARPSVLAGTISSVREHLGFIDRVLVVAPHRLKAEVSSLRVDFVADEDLLPNETPADHQMRNYALRSALAGSDAVADVFLMSDDDTRPLVDIVETVFVKDGRYRRYSFGWLDEWVNQATSFDKGQQATRQILGLYKFPRLSYASHMPQVVVKKMLKEVVEVLAGPAGRHSICEWSAYFNIAPVLHPELFHDAEPYVTLGWPENMASWQPLIEPGAFLFENHFPEHYGPNSVFAGIAPEDSSINVAVDKVVRWRHYELQVLAGLREPIIGKPPQATAISKTLRRVRAAAFGDPVRRDFEQRAAWAALLRSVRRP